jgi:hypothetical protein
MMLAIAVAMQREAASDCAYRRAVPIIQNLVAAMRLDAIAVPYIGSVRAEFLEGRVASGARRG